MAKKQKTKKFSFQGFNSKHYQTTEQYVAVVNALFNNATSEIASLAARGKYNPDKPFSFADYPQTNKQVQMVVNGLANNMTSVIESGASREWLFACKKNDEFIASIMDTSKLDKAYLAKMQDRNLDALKTFQARKVNGMDLSKRVWRYVEQYKGQIEQGLDVGLGDGRSAQQLSKELRQNLKDPDRLFRRVRDKRGNLHLSKSAKVFHPGQGVYRSSYKNAMRLTRSEINMAYRESDWLRWQQLDFVVGFEVHRSNREPHFECPLCDKLIGRYPKQFKFVGWHPQCMCYATAIMEDFFSQERSDDRVNRLKAALNGTEYKKYISKETVTDVPQGFKDWVAKNEQKQTNWVASPYFVRDNFKDGKMLQGLKFDASAIPKRTLIPKLSPSHKAEPAQQQPKEQYSKNMPDEFRAKSKYLHDEDYTFDKKFFDLIDSNSPVGLKVSKANKGAYYSPGEKKVYLFDAARNANSNWQRKAVVYHEFGHAIDWQRNLRHSQELKDLRATQIKALRKQSTYTIYSKQYDYKANMYKFVKVQQRMSLVAYVDHRLKGLSSKIYRMNGDVFARRGITKYDVLEQIVSVRDTIKSLVISYGDGHTTAYFRRPGMSEAEYIAHAFENTFVGNEVFKKYLPEIYNEMIAYIRTLK